MTHTYFLVTSVALASAVEFVEALTIVLAVGTTRGWRSTLLGVGAAVVVLAGFVAALGPSITVVPISALRVVVGGLLLVFGLQWLRKAILRASGYKALHDEDAIFAREAAAARSAAVGAGSGSRRRIDWYAFTVAFKGMLLEGLEVAFIVVTFGGAEHELGPAVLGAAGAGVVVLAAGLAVRGPLGRVPENQLKLVVGLLLTSFGTFWAGEGIGVHWPGSEGGLLWLLALNAVASLVLVRALQHRRRTAVAPSAG